MFIIREGKVEMPKICVSLVRMTLKETGKCENGKSKHQAGFESATLSTKDVKEEMGANASE